MSQFDHRARSWDSDPSHWERSGAIAKHLIETIPLSPTMKALEYGAGTGILSFLLSDRFSEVTLMDNSDEMVQVMREKAANARLTHFTPLFFDLEHDDYSTRKFDCIFSQMVLHHVSDTYKILVKFYDMLNPGGYLAIADLYTEDGSFHGPGAQVHLGFDPVVLSEKLAQIGFKNITHQTCYEIQRLSGKKFPVFLLAAQK
ncbi:MAG: class I SAM-dependent methyltransferase [Breznakibacter sp.]